MIGAGPAWADEPQSLAPTVVTASRVERSSFDVPAAIDAYDQDQIQEGEPRINLTETLEKSPGVVANTRQNYAQDVQISIRGFGARSTFGVRGIKLYDDGIPLTMPDGQGQTGTIDLDTAGRIEVLRGPFSALYGNSAGGIIQVFTEDGPAEPTVTTSDEYGSWNTSKVGLGFGGTSGALNYIGDLTRFATGGYREHSAATRDILNGKAKYALDDTSTLEFVVNALEQPHAQDPLGLSKAQYYQDPRQVDPSALQFNTRKSVANYQSGLIYERHLDADDTIRAMFYGGEREVKQYQAITVSAQTPASSSGGVIGLDSDFGGVDLRWTRTGRILDRAVTLTAGVSYDLEVEGRKGWNDFVGSGSSQVLGVEGMLRRDETDTVYNIDQYLQAEWVLAPRWLLSAGIRHSDVEFVSKDHFVNVIPGNGDDSGSVGYGSTDPVAGLVFKAMPELNLYANAGLGFDTPTFDELAYSPNGQSGLNFGLKASTAWNYEIGAKALIARSTRANLALFRIDTENEISVLSNNGGRSVYQNIGRTRRNGAELSVDSAIGGGFDALAAFTYLDAAFASNFETCVAPGCTSANVPVPSGNKLPGVPPLTLYGEFGWSAADEAVGTALEGRYVAKTFANDTNADFADAYAVAAWRVVLKQGSGGWRFSEFLRVDNLFDKKYIGSVIVNEGNGRFFEPAPSRSVMVGIRAGYGF